jgi:hypothetical protein
MKLVLNFLPIIIIVLLVTYTAEIADISHTILGKIVAVSIILFYSSIDRISGLFVCLLIILYYQSDYIESFTREGLETKYELLDTSPKITPNEPEIKSLLLRKEEFRNTYCTNGHLVYKGQSIRPDMAEHIFPEIEERSFKKCNICNTKCDLNFVNKKIDNEEEIKSKMSKHQSL